MREGRHKQRQIERKRERWGRDWEKKRKTEKGKARETRDENSERERETDRWIRRQIWGGCKQTWQGGLGA